MNRFVVFFCLLFCTALTAQDFTKDTIQLQTVNISKRKVKIKSQYISSFCTHHENLRDNMAMVTLMDDLPVGYLHSITYVFNNAFDAKTADFKDAEVELLFFEVNDDKTPGNKLSYSKKTVFVSKDFSGKMEIDLKGLTIKSDGKLFIGVKNLTKNIGNKAEFEVDGVCMSEKNSKREFISYDRRNDASPWQLTRYPIEGIKMRVKVEVL